jgi:hypothetical protein
MHFAFIVFMEKVGTQEVSCSVLVGRGGDALKGRGGLPPPCYLLSTHSNASGLHPLIMRRRVHRRCVAMCGACGRRGVPRAGGRGESRGPGAQEVRGYGVIERRVEGWMWGEVVLASLCCLLSGD